MLRGFMRHGLTLECLGLVADLAAALVLTRLMESLLFAVRPKAIGNSAHTRSRSSR